jgi:HAD superfamily hydrolase (TIGR01509 family)
MPTPIRAVVFDFDGVLVDSEPVRFRAGAQALAEVGVVLTWEQFLATWFGRTDTAGLGDILGPRFATEGPGVIARRNVLYEQALEDVPAYPDAARLLRRLPPGIRAAVATGSRRLEVERILAHLGLSRHFHVLVTAEDYRRAKPDPDPFLTAARRLGEPPHACLVVEDSPAGVAAAREAEMPVVAVDRGRGADLARATWLVQSLDALVLGPSGEVIVHAC